VQQRLASDCRGLASKKRPFRVGKPKSLPAELLFEKPILGLEEFDDRQLMPVHPA